MLYKDRISIVKDYQKWLEEQNNKNDFKIVDSSETFLAYLDSKGLLKVNV